MSTSLDPAEWEKIKEFLGPALELPPEHVTHYLNKECVDPELRKRVRTFFNALHFDRDFLKETADVDRSSTNEAIGEGCQIGSYRLLKKIDEGGMGEVFMASQGSPVRRTVALKLIRSGLVSSQALVRFQVESQILALMSHPNIAQVYDAGEGPQGRPYIVMEHLDGQTITEYCDAERLTIEERLQLFQQVLEGARHAHRKGVIHRDLKPSNILVVMDEEPVPKIIDFGIAKVHEVESGEAPDYTSSLLTEPGQWLGTLEYMSPEQAGEASGAVDIRSDVYSLGVLLYELLCGTRPLEFPDPRQVGLADLLDMILHKDPPRPSERLGQEEDALLIAQQRRLGVAALKRRLGGDLNRIVMKALAKDPGKRYESAGEMAEDIRRYLAGIPLLSASPSALEQVVRWVRRYRVAASVAALLLLSMLAGIIGTTHGLVRARRAEATAHAQAEKARVESRRAHQAAASSQQIIDFLISVFDASDPTQSRQNDVTLREVLDNSAQRVRSELVEQPLVQARMMAVMSYTYKSLGAFEKARIFGEEALAEFRTRPDEHRSHIVDALFASSEAYFELGQYDLCLSYLEEALLLENQSPTPDSIELARIFNNLGMAYRKTKKLTDARNALEKALQLKEQLHDEDDLNFALTLDNLGLVLHNLGENQLAAVHLERSLHVHEQTLGPDHPELSYSLNNLAMVRSAEGDHVTARNLFERAVEIDRKAFGADHPNVAKGLFNLGYLAMEHGDCPTSLSRFLEAQPILQNTLALDDWRVVEIAEVIKKQRQVCGP